MEDRPAGSNEMKELEQFLLDRAMEHDSPTLLFSLAREYLASAKVIRPGAIGHRREDRPVTARPGAAPRRRRRAFRACLISCCPQKLRQFTDVPDEQRPAGRGDGL